MRVIYVPVADRSECVIALNTAFDIGNVLGASVIGCHIKPHAHSSDELPSTLDSVDSDYDEIQNIITSDLTDSGLAEHAAEQLFAHLAELNGYSLKQKPSTKRGAVWMKKTGSPGKVIGIVGPVVDLLVLSRPTQEGATVARQFLLAALLKSGRPVLVLPQTEKCVIGKRICIAWDQSIEAARAVAAALPFLTRAEQVSIVTCGAETRPGPKSGQLASYLKFWGVKTKHFSMPGKDESEEMMATYKSTGSDLLVMGAYTRNRINRLIFGSMTKYMLERSSIPILVLHT